MNITCEQRDDFDIDMLKNVVESATTVVHLLQLLDGVLQQAHGATKLDDPDLKIPDSHTRKLKAWDAILDLHLNRRRLFLDNPRRVPFQYYFDEQTCEAIYHRIERTMKYVDIMGGLWERNDPLITAAYYAMVLDAKGGVS